jgi:hypothetical protein
MPTITTLLAILLFTLPAAASAQEASRSGGASRGVHVYVGVWTSHLTRVRSGVDGAWLVAVGWRSLYGSTFVNSFGDRAFAVGIERDLARADGGTVARGLGYRLGLVTGYDERLVGFAGKVPVLPGLQVLGNMAVGPTGLELAWAGKVATVSPFMRVAR